VTRSHPPTLITEVERTLREECEVRGGQSVLVAVSGGPDSMALLDVLRRLAKRSRLRLAACGVDHGLRAAAAEELDLVASFCSEHGLAFERVAVQVARGGNLQARARDARYAALEGVRARLDFDFLATAHHAQDRAETVLLRLLRGAGPPGLALLLPRQGHFIRPMIRADKSAIESHLQQHRIPSANDPSNLDPRYLRTRVRTELLPLLQMLSPGIVGHLTSLADELAEPALPPVHDENGEPIRLNRSQRRELRHAIRDRSFSARVLLSGGRVIRLDPQSAEPRVVLRAAAAVEDVPRLHDTGRGVTLGPLTGPSTVEADAPSAPNLPSRSFKNPTTG
jgi:tRNA(Ile)-lysidine synthase